MVREMKDSGIEWIGEIPEEWEVLRNKSVFSCKKQIVGMNSKSTQLLSLTTKGVKKRAIVDTYGKVPESYDTYQVVDADDIIMCLFDLDCSAVFAGISEMSGMISPAYKVLKCNYRVVPQFANYWFGFIFVDRKFKFYAKNLRYTLTYDEFAVLPILIPDRNAQRKISSFLNEKCTKLDNVLEKTRASIEEYKKLKQAIITQTVSKGVHDNRGMKDSGNKWIREIPSDIKISRVGLHYQIILGKMLCTNQIDDTYTYEPYFCAADIHFEGIAESGRKKMWFSPLEKQQYLVRKDDLLVVEGGAGAGGCTVAPMQEVPTYIQNSIMIVRPGKSADVRYLKYLLECLVKQGYIDVTCNKATIPHFTKDKLANVPFLVFSLQEQKEIAQYLDKKCSDIDAIISYKENYIMEV